MAADSKIYENCAVVVNLNLVGGEESTPQWEHIVDAPYLNAGMNGITLNNGDHDRHFGDMRVARNYQIGKKWAGRYVRNERQVSIATLQDLESIASKLELTEIILDRGISIGRFMSQALAVNVVISGADDLTEYLGPGTKLFCGDEETGTILGISEAHLPCSKPALTIARSLNLEIRELKGRFKDVAKTRRGYVASVYSPGIIALEDSLDAQLPIDHREIRVDWHPESL